MAFEAITTQEQLDGIISDRLKRERETAEKKAAEKYGDYDDFQKKVKDYEEKIGTLNGTIEENAKKIAELDKSAGEMQAKIKGYETDSVKMRIAHEKGIPFEMASRLAGDDEEAIRKDAEAMAKFTTKQNARAPLASTEPAGVDEKRAAMKNMLSGLKGE